ncbi:MAG: cystathionine gamma-synthase family protein [Desulfurococcaceae archaeon]
MPRDGTIYSRGPSYDDPYGSGVFPIYTSAVYEYVDHEAGMAKFDDAGRVLKYGRESNPTVRYLERLVAMAEGAQDAIAFSSGMAAITSTLIALARRGAKIVVPYEVYSTTIRFLEVMSEKFGLKYALAWPSAESILEEAGRGPAIVFLEVLTNPTLKVIDVDEVARGLVEGSVLVVDNTFTTPMMFRPLDHGAAAVVHSATKYLAGHNDVVGGVVATSTKLASELWEYRRIMGTIMSPFEAYLTARGMRTLHLRFERSCSNALALAEFLEDHPRVEEVYYPGLRSSPYHELARKLFGGKYFGGVLSFKVRASYGELLSRLSRLRVIRRSPSLGATETMMVLPYKSVSAHIPADVRVKLGITENLVRLAVGVEDVEDLKEDLSAALS